MGRELITANAFMIIIPDLRDAIFDQGLTTVE